MCKSQADPPEFLLKVYLTSGSSEIAVAQGRRPAAVAPPAGRKCNATREAEQSSALAWLSMHAAVYFFDGLTLVAIDR
jgi:hypothetical protein